MDASREGYQHANLDQRAFPPRLKGALDVFANANSCAPSRGSFGILMKVDSGPCLISFKHPCLFCHPSGATKCQKTLTRHLNHFYNPLLIAPHLIALCPSLQCPSPLCLQCTFYFSGPLILDRPVLHVRIWDAALRDWYCRELELQCLNSQTLVVDNTSKRAREPAHARARTHTHTHIHTHTGRERSGGSCARSATHSHSTLPACCAATTAATAEWSNCPGCRWPGCKAWEWD
eukprot:1161965-Pelagomonas_calceolata.AAC.4